MHAVELYLDAEADRRVREIWARLDERGVPSLGSRARTFYRPHVTLCVFDAMTHPDAVVDVLSPVTHEARGMPLALVHLGMFLTDEAPAFLAVRATRRLLDLHERVDAALDLVVGGLWEPYRPETWVPHCTLSLGSREYGTVAEVVEAAGLPIEAVVDEVHLVEIATGRSTARLA